jgi:ribosome-associated protein
MFITISGIKDCTKVSKLEEKYPSADEIAELCIAAAEAGKGEDIVKLKVSELSVVADYFILCTANSDPHLRAVAERLKREVSRRLGVKPRQDGAPASSWIVMDYGNVVVHILSPEMREYYQLESLWGDSPDKEALEKVAAPVNQE